MAADTHARSWKRLSLGSSLSGSAPAFGDSADALCSKLAGANLEGEHASQGSPVSSPIKAWSPDPKHAFTASPSPSPSTTDDWPQSPTPSSPDPQLAADRRRRVSWSPSLKAEGGAIPADGSLTIRPSTPRHRRSPSLTALPDGWDIDQPQVTSPLASPASTSAAASPLPSPQRLRRPPRPIPLGIPPRSPSSTPGAERVPSALPRRPAPPPPQDLTSSPLLSPLPSPSRPAATLHYAHSAQGQDSASSSGGGSSGASSAATSPTSLASGSSGSFVQELLPACEQPSDSQLLSPSGKSGSKLEAVPED